MVTIDGYLNYALDYAERGIAIFPCHELVAGVCSCNDGPACVSPGKHPRTPHGYNAATTDPAQIRSWWTHWPTANIGAAMIYSRLFLVDIDPRNGGDDAWHELTRGRPEFETWTALTGGGGVHYVFRVPEGFECSANNLAPGVDVKWKGYAILPPSLHVSGERYAWESSPTETTAALLPDWLHDAILSRSREAEGAVSPIADLLGQDCASGARNETLTRIGGYLRNTVSQDVALTVCHTWNQLHGKPPLPDDEVERTIQGLYLRYPPPATITFGTQQQQPRKDGRHYEIVSAPEFVKRPPLRWLVPGLLSDKAAFITYGPPASYKSFFVLDLLASLAAGIEFHRFSVKQGPCLYVAAEGSGGVMKRLRAWQKKRGVAMPSDLYILPGVVPLLSAEAVLKLVEDVKKFDTPFVAIVFDTLSRAIAGADENQQKEMSLAMDAMGAIQAALGCSVGAVHHGRKTDGALRGSGVLDGAFDTIWKVTADDLVTVQCEKQKDGELFKPMLFKKHIVPLTPLSEPGQDADGFWITAEEESVVLERLDGSEEERTAAMARLKRFTVHQRKTLKALDRFSPHGATESEWKAQAIKDGVIRQTFDKQLIAFDGDEYSVAKKVGHRDGEDVWVLDGRYQGLLATSREAGWLDDA